MQTELINPNTIHCGDNLAVMKRMPDESVDLIYLDPPFFSGRNYEVIWKDGTEERSFKDTEWYRVECPGCEREVVKAERFCPVCGEDLKDAKITRKNDIYSYIDWMVPRLTEMYRILKPTGSIYLHVDWHAVYYLKIEMDRIFGMKNFQNEIVWHYGLGAANAKKTYLKKHDTILVYNKSNNYTFNLQRGDVTPQMKAKYCHTDENGKYMMAKGKKYYLKGGKPLDSVWDIPTISPTAAERLGYPTQKPEALLDRIIKASSNEGDIVFDPFCGCGTSLAVAAKLNRHYIGIDISPTSCMVIADRIDYTDRIRGMQYTDDQYMKMEPHEFQNLVCDTLNAKSTTVKGGADGGVDGFVDHDVQIEGIAGSPIQVKRSRGVGINTIKNLESTMQHLDTQPKIGFVVAISFGTGARKQAKEAKKLGLKIILIEAKQLYNFDFDNIMVLIAE